MRLNRKQRAVVAAETVAILEAGKYLAPSGCEVIIAEAQERAEKGTVLYTPAEVLEPRGGEHDTVVTVANETTLTAARRLSDDGVFALNFASAKNPGGGFLGGSEAQEESLARSSGLYRCIVDSPYYAANRRHRDPLYTDHMIYSPDVPVFRDDDGELLEDYWLCSFLTAPAPNAGAVLSRDAGRIDEVEETMRRRIGRVLAAAALHGHNHLVLGAFGCGVFKNDPVMVARLWDDALQGAFAGAFACVHFAVLDRGDAPRFRAFVDRLG